MSTKALTLSNGQIILVDEDDLPLVFDTLWHISGRETRNTRYVRGYVKSLKKDMFMHRFILGVDDPKIIVDHINGNGLDNRKENLRICSNQQNTRNAKRSRNGSSLYKGVYFAKQNGKWRARIQIGAQQKHLGYFDNEVVAARAYDEAARKYFAEFAACNFPTNKERSAI